MNNAPPFEFFCSDLLQYNIVKGKQPSEAQQGMICVVSGCGVGYTQLDLITDIPHPWFETKEYPSTTGV